jgi:xylulokinase
MVRATIGIDVGTSAVKVLVLGEGGNVLAESSRSYPTRSPRPGWMEQAPEDWWRATCAALHEATQATEAELAGIGLSGQLNGMVLLDPDDKPIGDAIIWLDTRAVAEAEELKGRFRDLLLSRAATDLSPIALLPKFAWLARNEPARLARARSVLMVKDYLLWRLTGVVATDPSDAAATGMMDVETQVWIPELCAAAGLDPTVLPPIVPSMAIVGHVTAAAAAATGLPEDLPVVPGGGDVAALTVGCGVSKPGVVGITLGTAGHVVLAVDRAAPFAPSTAIWRLPHADPVHAIWLGLVMSGGLSLAWLHHVLSGANHALPFETMTALSNSARPGAGGVSFVPFLEGAATPYGDPWPGEPSRASRPQQRPQRWCKP